MELEEEEEEGEEEEPGFCAPRGTAAGDSDGARMIFSAQKCGVCFQPPSIILIYRDNVDKTRQRIMPIRNFSRFSDCCRAAEQLKNNPRHKPYLEGVSLRQLEKLYSLLRDHLEGQSLSESLGRYHHEHTIDPEEDMNKLDDKELAKRKSIMDELFEKNRKRRDDPDFVYNVEVDFPQDEHLEACAWDTESDEEM
ncbi:LOW QUALITY PROTEIN: centrosomal protein of 19 kDa [Molothrus ater]|uniref:LOW QUALITY PROTEIN: centrosomal protein of 19 kDa n=1 Tax=Molothrus ater TaxID=84834 RepID=UPI0023E81A4A|nr:LOW QUALITY PROTEIN: centrosomal protein of 19 kDa [Molothrus ater]